MAGLRCQLGTKPAQVQNRVDPVPMAAFNHDTGNGKRRRSHIDRMRRRHSPVKRKITAIVEEHGAIDYALEWETWCLSKPRCATIRNAPSRPPKTSAAAIPGCLSMAK